MAPTTRSTNEATATPMQGGTPTASPTIGSRLFTSPLGKAAAEWYAKRTASKPTAETVYFEDDDDDSKPAASIGLKPAPAAAAAYPKPALKPAPVVTGYPKPALKPAPATGNAASGDPSASGLGNKAPEATNAVAPSINLAALTQILAALNQDASTSRRSFQPPVQPRVGGVDDIGAWTGKGAQIGRAHV